MSYTAYGGEHQRVKSERSIPSALPVLRTERTVARHLEVRDAPTWLEYLRLYGHRYEPPPPPEVLTLEACEALAMRAKQEFVAGNAVRLHLFTPDEGELIGDVGVAHIIRGARWDCRLSYAIHPAYEGRGIASEAVRALIDYAFLELGLHRIEASHAPTNQRSERLLTRLGFERVGTVRGYLHDGTHWRDSVIHSLLNPGH